MARQKNRRKASIGVLFWIALIMFLLVVFLFSRSQIQQVLQTTGLVQVIKDKFSGKPVTLEPTSDAPTGTGPVSNSAPAGTNGGTTTGTSGGSNVVVTTNGGAETPAGGRKSPSGSPSAGSGGGPAGGSSASSGGTTSTGGAASSSGQRTPTATTQTSPETTTRVATNSTDSSSGSSTSSSSGTAGAAGSSTSPGSSYHTRLSTIYFTRVTDDGRILPEAVVREVKYTDSPLTDTIDALLAGPTAEELNKGLLNLIPEKTRLISAQVQNGIAYLNFNDAFGFNPMGVEGFLAQLKEVVHTATEFSTVSRVQFLIDGKKLDYLGGEGIYIGKPLSRDSFS